MLRFMKNVIHLDSDFARNTCNQICANVQFLVIFPLLRFRNTVSCRPGTVGGIEGKKIEIEHFACYERHAVSDCKQDKKLK